MAFNKEELFESFDEVKVKLKAFQASSNVLFSRKSTKKSAIMNMRTPASVLGHKDDEIIPVGPNEDVDFSEYMWMEQMEEFDQQFEEELMEQEMIEQGFEDLFEMEQLASEILSTSPVENVYITFDSTQAGIRTHGIAHARQEPCSTLSSADEVIVTSRLNPLAPEFVPSKTC